MEIPGWVFVLVGSIVTAISFIIYANTGSFQLFIAMGIIFFIYGIGKMAVTKLRAKNEDQLNKEMAKFSKPTTFKDLPIGKEYYRQQLGNGPQPAQWGHPQRVHHANPHQTQHNTHAHIQHPTHGHIQHSTHSHMPHANTERMHPQHPSQPHRQAHPQYHSPFAYCRTCGARNHANVNFCGNCGGRMR